MIDDKIIEKYQEMSDLTWPKCRDCPSKLGAFGCCNRTACEITLSWARERWGVDLRDKFKDKQKIPFQGKNGHCMIEPHLRPHCTVYTCKIHAFGADPDTDWTKKYWKLRNKIDDLEWRHYEKQKRRELKDG